VAPLRLGLCSSVLLLTQALAAPRAAGECWRRLAGQPPFAPSARRRVGLFLRPIAVLHLSRKAGLRGCLPIKRCGAFRPMDWGKSHRPSPVCCAAGATHRLFHEGGMWFPA